MAALRLTQERFAERIGYSAAAVAKWERATRARPVRGEPAQDLDTELTRLDDGQRARFEKAINALEGDHPPPRASPPPREPHPIHVDAQEGDVNRRAFGKLATTTAAVVALPDGRGRIHMDDVRHLRTVVDSLYKQDQRTGGVSLIDLATVQLRQARTRLETSAYDCATGNAFASVTGELAMLCGWLAYDADRNPLAQHCYATAMSYGAEVGNDTLIAYTCLYAANQSSYLARTGLGGSPYKSLQLVDRARQLVRGRPPGRVHALIALRDAQAYGLLGDPIAFGRAISTAWRELDAAEQHEPLEDVAHCLRFVTHSEATDQEARGYADVGNLAKAVELYSAAIEQPAATRNATMIRAWSATTRARIGDLTGALEHGQAALAGSSAMSSARVLSRLRPLRVAVDDSLIGADFRDTYDDLNRKAMITV